MTHLIAFFIGLGIGHYRGFQKGFLEGQRHNREQVLKDLRAAWDDVMQRPSWRPHSRQGDDPDPSTRH